MTESNGQPDRYSQTAIRWQLILWIAQGLLLLSWIPAANWFAGRIRQGNPTEAEIILPCLAIILGALSCWLVQMAILLETRRQLRRIDAKTCDKTLTLKDVVFQTSASTCVLAVLLLLPSSEQLTIPFFLVVFFSPLLLFLVWAQSWSKGAQVRSEKASDVQEMDGFLIKHAGRGVRLQTVQDYHLAATYGRVGRQPVIRISADLFHALAPSERLAIVAHELAHHVKNHLLLREILSIVLYGCLWCVSTTVTQLLTPDQHNPAGAIVAMPIAALAIWIVAILSHAALARLEYRQELAADRWAIGATGAPDAFASAMQKLAERSHAQGGGDSWLAKLFFETHPTLEQVLGQVDEYKRTHQGQSHAGADTMKNEDTVGGPRT